MALLLRGGVSAAGNRSVALALQVINNLVIEHLRGGSIIDVLQVAADSVTENNRLGRIALHFQVTADRVAGTGRSGPNQQPRSVILELQIAFDDHPANLIHRRTRSSILDLQIAFDDARRSD